MIVLIIIAAILLIMGIIILIGKGDNLIAGYNTASEEEKAQYNIKRLRGLIGSLLIILAPTMFLLHREPTMTTSWSFLSIVFILSIVVFILSIIVVILANTWAKKK